MKKITYLIQQTALRFVKASGIKYLAVIAAAAVWMVFFDRYNLVSRQKLQTQIEQLKKDEAHYRTSIEAIDYEHDQIFSDREELERFAREQYHLKRANEDVYLITEPKAAPAEVAEKPVQP
ncbi:MAG: septum formation initiator family protein [Bacteroidetes bacterium]|jgi:cell division protein FtsB|nr:MAG: septum formation initiator family protein [Bacteroidota bacterium]